MHSPTIRVESDDVRVPVIVLNKARLNAIHRMNPITFVAQVNAPRSDLIEGLFVRGLSAKDFKVFEDGIEQKIERVSFQISPAWDQKPRRSVVEGGSVQTGWTLSVQMPDWPRYLVAYTLPPSPERSCHKISVKIDRPDVLVYWQHRYCSRTDWLEDPLRGTKLGREMQAELNSRKAGKLKLTLSAFPHLATGALSTVNVILAFPTIQRRLKDCSKPPPISYLGVAYDQTSRTVLAQFSGLVRGNLNNVLGQTSPILLPTESTSCLFVPPSTPFQAQIRLAPGQYELKMLVRDGKNFGRAEIPVAVEETDPGRLAVSAIVLGKGFQKISGASERAPDEYEHLTSNGYEMIPTANPRFAKGGEFCFYLEVYEPRSGMSTENGELHLRIVDAKTRHVVESLKPVATAGYKKPGDPVIPIGGGIDIRALPSGSYWLEAQATDSPAKSTPWRTANFTIDK